ncbi:MAG: RNA polymerase sigma-70 factor, ECF subfamily protein [Gemmatimonadota bacterium]
MEHLFRRCHGRLLSSLARALGPARLDLAEEVVQDALLRALKVWPYQGVPRSPEAWLRRVARNRALDLLRREGRMEELVEPAVLDGLAFSRAPGSPGEDDELAMVVLCCHPSLSPDAQVALTLRTVGGLSTDEIAAAFLAERATIQQRIVRAKRTLAAEAPALRLPAGPALARRREAVLAVLYLMFNEGHAATGGEALVRSELCGEAVRLARLVAAHPALGGPQVEAFLALLLFQASRLPARQGDDGALVLLADQDRARWDRALMAEGFHHLERATETDTVTRWHLEAGIASGHAAAASWGDTDWPRILDLYDLLHQVAPSPVVAVNRAVAVALARSPEAGLEALEEVWTPPGYYLLQATRGHLLGLAGRSAEAAVETRRALMACRNAAVRAHLERRIEALEATLASPFRPKEPSP